MNDGPIDLSPLDPSRDRLRWERMIRATAARATRPRPNPVLADLSSWARPLLAMAAALALLAWLPALLGRGAGTTAAAAAARDPALSLSTWASTGELPATADLLATLGGEDGVR